MAPAAILCIVTSHAAIDADHPTGLWLEELALPFQIFRAAGHPVTLASPRGGPAPVDPRSAPDDTQRQAWQEPLAALQQTRPLSEIDPGDFAAVFLPGGHGTMFDLPDNPELQRILGHCAAQAKPIGAVCHGPAGLVGVQLADDSPLVRGKTLTAFTDAEERAVELDGRMPFLLESRLRALGAQFVAGDLWADHVERDGLLVTGQNPASSASAARALLAALD